MKARLRWREALPIVVRELRAVSKRRFTYRLRIAAAMLGAANLFLLGLFPIPPTLAGNAYFWVTSLLMALVCGGSGLILSADSVSREKREGTLGLLFLTRITGIDVILGKLTVALLTGGSIAFAALPFMAFSVCLGGVTVNQFWTMSLFLLFLLVYSVSLGIFVSTFFRRESVVSLVFCLAMAWPALATPVALLKWKAIPPMLANFNPFYPALSLMDARGRWFPQNLVAGALTFQLFAVLGMIAVAGLLLPWLARVKSVRKPLKIETTVVRKARSASRRAVLEINPVLWLSARENRPLLLLGLLVGLRFVLGFASLNPAETEIAYIALLALLPKTFVLWQATGMMAAERRSGFLEALLTTPIRASEVLEGKVRAIKRQIWPAALFALLVQWLTSTRWWAASGEIPLSTTLVFMSMIALLLDVHMIAWVGLWQGLMARDRRRALVWALLWGVVGPWIPVTVIYGLIAALIDPSWMSEPLLAVPPAIIFANVCSLALACLAMALLHEKFRSTATQTWSFRAA